MAAPGRLEVMNALTTHSKVRLKLDLSATAFLAGEDLTGKMELDSRADKGLALGRIHVELIGSQSLSSRDHSALSHFLTTKREFQGPGLPPSNAVYPFPPLSGENSSPLPRDYYPARKGITTFFYQLPIPITSPASIDFSNGLAKITYLVRASVQVLFRGDYKVVTGQIEANIIEPIPLDLAPECRNLVLGEGGKLGAEGMLIGGYAVSGNQACISMKVKNHTAKATQGFSLSLVRKLNLTDSQIPANIRPMETLLTVQFKAQPYCVQPNSEGLANIVFTVPKGAQGVRGGNRLDTDGRSTGALFEMQCAALIKVLYGGIGSKEIVLNLNLPIFNPKAVEDTATQPYPGMQEPSPPRSPVRRPLPQPQGPQHQMPVYDPRAPAMVPVHHHHHHNPQWGTHYETPAFAPSGPHQPQHYYHNLPPSPPFAQHPWTPQHHPYYAHLHHPLSPASIAHPSAGYIYYSPPQPMWIPEGQPVRPMSAEPPTQTAFEDPAPAQPPATSSVAVEDPTPLATTTDDPNKGTIARRVSHHLRASSQKRGRSASPPASRSQILPAPLETTQPIQIPSLLSPRPMISPRQSYEAPSTMSKLGTVRSENVVELERLAEEFNKTLPPPPVPSGKFAPPTKVANAMPSMPEDQELDVHDLIAQEGIIPLSQEQADQLRAGRTGGLEALEKRLLADVGTRRFPEPAFVAKLRQSGTLRPPQPARAGTGTPPPSPKQATRELPQSSSNPSPPEIKVKPDGSAREGEMRRMRLGAKDRVQDWLVQQETADIVKESESSSPPVESPLKNKMPRLGAGGLAPPVVTPRINGAAGYDVRSARGGKGGIVTSVAAIWAAADKENDQQGKSSPKAALPAPKPQVVSSRPPALLGVPKSGPTVALAGSSAKNEGKSPTVPAILSSKMATPVLSSTASLARAPITPQGGLTRTRPLPLATVSEEPSRPEVISPKPVAVGRAKLRDLIKKYEGIS